MTKLVQKTLLVCLLVCSHISLAGTAHKAAVAMPDSYSADAARAILEQGGNAVDAAITAQFVLAVTLPEAGNIGGGGFMLVKKGDTTDFIDYREKAPLKAHRDMYLDKDGNVISNLSIFGILAGGVPGTTSGMWLAHQKYGSLDWKTLVQPAVDLAEKGFIVHPKLAGNIKRYAGYLAKKDIKVNFAEYFGHAKAGETFKQPELAGALKRIRDHGNDGFYKGKTADLIVAAMKKHGGLVTHKDLEIYKAKSRKPIVADWKGYQVLTAPPPSSGGIAVLQWLKMYETLAPKYANLEHNSADYLHLLSEIGKRVFADRAEYLGDPDFYPVPVKQLTSDKYIAKRASQVSLKSISNTEKVKPGLHESEDTTHFSIVDKWGNAVSNTTTINLTFGSGQIIEGAGFILNDEMDDFSAKPGVANAFGALGGKANEIQPEKRMLSSMSPSMLLKDGKVEVVTGSPGGTTIITSVYQSILNVIEFDMNAEQAVNAPRFHHQLHPKDTIRHHDGISEKAQARLKKMGYKLDNRRFGDLHMVVNKDGKLQAGSEASGRGKSIVF